MVVAGITGLTGPPAHRLPIPFVPGTVFLYPAPPAGAGVGSPGQVASDSHDQPASLAAQPLGMGGAAAGTVRAGENPQREPGGLRAGAPAPVPAAPRVSDVAVRRWRELAS